MSRFLPERRQHPRERGRLVEIENVAYRVLRNYEEPTAACAGQRAGERALSIEVVRPAGGGAR